jgi:pyrroline-5-carboxylate reductase
MIENLVLVGAGHMGRAMLQPWLAGKAAKKIWVIEPQTDSLKDVKLEGATVLAKSSELPAGIKPDVVVIAIRPQIVDQVLEDYVKFPGALFLSIAAGKKLETYTKILGAEARIIRAMPNLAAKVQEAAILLVAGGKATSADRTVAEVLCSPLGKSFWLDREDLMDAATALSGCGPGYFYFMADAMALAGEKLGLPKKLSEDLARQTLIGSALFCKDEDASLEKLYQNVAVKGGMTEAAINVLKDKDALKALMESALQAAVDRAKKLAS